MSLPKHIKEHTQLGLPEAIAGEFDAVQLEVGTGYFPITHGPAGANLTTTAQAIYMLPFLRPEGMSTLLSIDVFAENNGATSANRLRYGVWDAAGNLLTSGNSPATMTSDGAKSAVFGSGVAIPTKAFWFGFAAFENGGTWQAVEFRSAEPQVALGYLGKLNDSSLGTISAPPYVIVKTTPTDAMNDPLISSNLLIISQAPRVYSAMAQFS